MVAIFDVVTLLFLMSGYITSDDHQMFHHLDVNKFSDFSDPWLGCK